MMRLEIYKVRVKGQMKHFNGQGIFPCLIVFFIDRRAKFIDFAGIAFLGGGIHHLGETGSLIRMQLAARRRLKDGLELPVRVREEMRSVLRVSRDNHGDECWATDVPNTWEEMDMALRELDGDLHTWLERWFLPAEDRSSKGIFSLTSG